MIEQIKNNASLEEVFSILWVRYKRTWNTGFLYHQNKLTDWWKADFSSKIVTDFSGKWRPSWDIVKFTGEYLWLNINETIDFLSSRFNIKKMEKKASNILKDKWDNLPSLSNEQIEYLKSRKIYSAPYAKNNNWLISLPIKTIWWEILSLQSRAIDDNASIRYRVEKDSNSDWIFHYEIDYELDYIIVVEWFTDFLSLRQYTSNVVWLFNAKSDNQLTMIKELSTKFKIFLIPDNDESWAITVEKLKWLNTKFNLFKLIDYWVKDTNELLVNYWIWEEIIDVILQDSERPLSNMRLAIEKAKVYRKLYEDNWWRMWFSTGYPLIDNLISWFIKWKTYLIMAFSNVWKTRFAYSITRACLEQKKKVHFYSLEVDTGMLIIELLSSLYKKSREEVLLNLEKYNLDEVEEYIEIYDDIRSMDAIEQNITLNKPDIAIIDFVQNIENKWQEYEKVTDIALRIQKLWILTGTTMVSLSQVNNESRFWDWATIMPKWSWALFASSDVIISLWAKEWEKYLTVAKNKFWRAWDNFLMEIDYWTSTFNLAKPLNWEVSTSKYRKI